MSKWRECMGLKMPTVVNLLLSSVYRSCGDKKSFSLSLLNNLFKRTIPIIPIIVSPLSGVADGDKFLVLCYRQGKPKRSWVAGKSKACKLAETCFTLSVCWSNLWDPVASPYTPKIQRNVCNQGRVAESSYMRPCVQNRGTSDCQGWPSSLYLHEFWSPVELVRKLSTSRHTHLYNIYTSHISH